MAVTIADLEVNIRDNGQSATLALNALINTLQKLASNIAPATKGLKETTKELKTVDKTASSAASGGLNKFFKSIVRIAGYRAIRSALKMITSGFREGVQNIALYSQAVGGIDASKANNVMSAYASMGAQIKNSLGAAVMPLLANLLPWIQKVTDAFMDLTEGVAKFFATLNGQATYTAANRDYWVDYAKGLQKSTGAAKELKRTILGFDEINALNSQSKGGSGSTAPNYKDMFVEKTNDWFGLKNIFEGVATAVFAIGAGIAAWRMSSAFISGLDKLLGLGTFLKVGIGLTLMVIGVKWAIDAGAAFAKGDTLNGIKNTIGAVFASGIGGALLGSAIPGVGNAVGFVVGIGIAIVAEIISFVINSSGAYESINGEAYHVLPALLEKYGLKVDDISEDGIHAQIQVTTTIINSYDKIKEKAQESLANIEVAKTLIGELFSFDAKKNKTGTELARVNILCEAINNLNLDGVRVEWDKTTGVIKTTRGELDEYIKSYERSIRLQAYEEIARESMVKKIKLQSEYNRMLDELDTMEQMILRTRGEEQKQWTERQKELGKAALKVHDEIIQMGEDYDNAILSIYEINSGIDEGMGVVEDGCGRAREAIDSVADAADVASVDIRETLKKSFDPKNIIKPGTWADALKSAVSNLPSINFTVSGSNLIPRVQTKASGGFVPTGDLFWAGERAPELIMSAPGGSEVVNMAQFQDAMVSAVMMAGGNGGGDWTIVVQDESGAVRSRQVITAAERANRRDGRTIVPVGVQ